MILSPIKWAGGKRWLAPRIKQMLKEAEALAGKPMPIYEPFAGGASVALWAAGDGGAILNDANPDLIGFWRCVQDGSLPGLDTTLLAMADRFAGLSFAPDMEQQAFLALRAEFNASATLSRADKALLFFVLNRTGFNGLCRYNKSGEFNITFGIPSSGRAHGRIVRNFTGVRTRIQDWKISCGPFSGYNRPSLAFIFAAPPYDDGFTEYLKEGFSWQQQQDLAHWLASECFAHPVVTTNHATPRILGLYRGLGFEVEVVPAPRSFASNGNREPVAEMIARRWVGSDPADWSGHAAFQLSLLGQKE